MRASSDLFGSCGPALYAVDRHRTRANEEGGRIVLGPSSYLADVRFLSAQPVWAKNLSSTVFAPGVGDLRRKRMGHL